MWSNYKNKLHVQAINEDYLNGAVQIETDDPLHAILTI